MADLFKRKLYDRLLTWKRESRGRTALLIEGARRVGKTTLVREFGESEYETCLFIDFSRARPAIRGYFEEFMDDLDSFFLYLSVATGVPLRERRSLIVFDEVQRFPLARQSIKHLVADGRYDYIETGSLISIRRNVEDILVPSEEHALRMDPMDFDEFLWALGEGPLADLVTRTFEAREPMPESLTSKANRLFREYMLVGGMPQAVARYVSDRDLDAVEGVKRDILAVYREDIAKFSGRDAASVRKAFDSLPAQLSRKSKRFMASTMGEGTRPAQLAGTFDWLDDSFIVNRCFRCPDPTIALMSGADLDTYKCYLADTGLLVSLAFPDASIAGGGVMRDVLEGRIAINEGMLTENIVAQCLRASGHDLFYWSSYDRAAKRSYEVDFLVPRGYGASGRMRVSPIEVKSSSHYKTRSLDELERRFGGRGVLGTSYVLAPKAPRMDESRQTLPLFYASRL